jgi:hypothetical protein
MSATTTDLYPCRDEVFYGRGVWPMGEDGDVGLMVEGHGRRALAAINAHERAMRGYGRWSEIDGYPGETERWVTIYETCGCTDEQHAQHEADEEREDGCPCRFPGLYPCDDRYGWTVESAAEGDPGAVAMTQVNWE